MGRPVLVKKVKPKALEKWADKDETLLGYFDPNAFIIYMDSTLDEASYNRILIHELTHATLAISGLTNLLDIKTEEAICDALENWYYL